MNGKYMNETTYNRDQFGPKIVHIGFGAFHRGHQAVYTDLTNQALADQNQTPWGIIEVNMFGDSTIIDNMRENNENTFTVIETSEDGTASHRVRAVSEAIHTPKDGIQAAIDALLKPEVKVVTLTITEKGYCCNLQNRQLDASNPLIVHDLENSSQPLSAIGLLALAIKLRKEQGLEPLTLLSCDNISENGVLLQNAVLGFAQKLDVELASYIETRVTFPSSMVDRIVPAITDESLKLIEKETGYRDVTGIVCESFRQWIIEDKFVSGYPDWSLAGAMFTHDVAIYEEMKLRMLNGSHTFLSSFGQLLGIDFIYETMQDETLRAVTRRLMLEDQAVSLSPKLDVDLTTYADGLLKRFGNQNVKHRTDQIIQDTSQKIMQRAVEPIVALAAKGHAAIFTPAMIAAWMAFVCKADSVIDPMANSLKEWASADNSEALFQSLFIDSGLFPEELQKLTETVVTIKHYFITIMEQGAAALLNELLEK